MALIYYFGDVPVERDEAKEKLATGELKKFALNNLKPQSKITFREGSVLGQDLFNNANLNLPDYTQIGINKPLSVEILCAYSGDAPQKFLGGKKDIMVVSGVKAYNTYGAAPKAINHIKKKVSDYNYITMGAFDDGSPIVYYSPAVDVSTTFCSFHLVADTFGEETFGFISNLFSSAAGLPIFAPAAPFLLAGSVISGMLGNIGKTLFESKPFMTEDEIFRFDTPGQEISSAKQMVVCNETDKNELKEYRPGLINDGDDTKKPALVSRKHGKAYKGNAPYILINVDGKARPELDAFAPKIATAAILEKYYGLIDKGSQVVDILESAMNLYNDFHFHQRAVSLETEISKMKKNSNDYKRASQILEAYKKNIKTDQFKIK